MLTLDQAKQLWAIVRLSTCLRYALLERGGIMAWPNYLERARDAFVASLRP